MLLHHTQRTQHYKGLPVHSIKTTSATQPSDTYKDKGTDQTGSQLSGNRRMCHQDFLCSSNARMMRAHRTLYGACAQEMRTLRESVQQIVYHIMIAHNIIMTVHNIDQYIKQYIT